MTTPTTFCGSSQYKKFPKSARRKRDCILYSTENFTFSHMQNIRRPFLHSPRQSFQTFVSLSRHRSLLSFNYGHPQRARGTRASGKVYSYTCRQRRTMTIVVARLRRGSELRQLLIGTEDLLVSIYASRPHAAQCI